MTKSIYQEIRDRFPPASQNNSRQIVMGEIERAVGRKSESRFQEVERDFGFPYDFSESDNGEERTALEE